MRFRAWNTFKNKWVKHFYITENGLIYNMEQQHRTLIGAVPIEKSGLIVMQSTGLFDKNGVEIFEGDVVELHHFTENYHITGGFYEGEETLVGVVKYGRTDDEIKYFGKVYPPRWLLKNRYRELDFSDLYGVHEESFEILGNIYENPELVEG